MRALRDPRPLGLLAVTLVLSAILSVTPLSGRAWLLLAWGVLLYAAAVVVLARGRRFQAPAPPPPPGQATAAPAPREEPAVDWPRLTEDALRKLNNPAALGECPLVVALPLTLQSRTNGGGPALRHQALRTVLVQGIDRLKPADSMEPDTPSLYCAVLREEYVLGYSTARIATRHAISDRQLFRYRRDGIRALAMDLAAEEAALARSKP